MLHFGDKATTDFADDRYWQMKSPSEGCVMSDTWLTSDSKHFLQAVCVCVLYSTVWTVLK